VQRVIKVASVRKHIWQHRKMHKQHLKIKMATH